MRRSVAPMRADRPDNVSWANFDLQIERMTEFWRIFWSKPVGWWPSVSRSSSQAIAIFYF